MNSQQIGIAAVLFVIIGGGSFYGGMKYQQKKTPALAMRGAFNGQAGGFGGAAGRMGGAQGQGRVTGLAGAGLVVGEVLSKDANTLTLKVRDGGSKIVLYTSSTHVSKMADGTVADVAAGTSVTVNGTSNQDGSVTADMIQIRPAGMGFGAGMATGTRP